MTIPLKSIALAALGCLVATAASAEVKRLGAVTVFTAPTNAAAIPATIDFANAREMPLPMSRRAPLSPAAALRLGSGGKVGKPGISPGRAGTGVERPVQVAVPRAVENEDAASVQPLEFGTAGQPYTTSRVNAQFDKTSRLYPFSGAGKLFFNIGSDTFVCSASMIKPGVLVTAAHCVADFGHSTYYTNWTYIPSYNKGKAPYGTWTTSNAYVLTAYFDGTDPCISGVVCQDDVAVLVQNPQDGFFPGTITGFFGYGVDGAGFNSDDQVLINQLGYPVALDDGELMQRNDSQGFVDPTQQNNTIIGSLMTGGSSGGPWLVNLGIAPKLQGTSFGNEATHNMVVGVTSWGYTLPKIKQMGASPFTTNNIGALVNQACTQVPAACQ